jgi:hypothetical protein
MEEEEPVKELAEELELEKEQKEKPHIALASEADNASLTFFSNPVYLGKINKKMTNDTKNKNNKNDIKFYRKRLISLFKELLKDEYPNPTIELKKAYEEFVIKSIHYFQITDKTDIIQEQHQHEHQHQHQHQQGDKNEQSLEDALNEIIISDETTLSEANETMMKKTVNVASLDNYVINHHRDMSANGLRIIPMKIEIDLKTHDLKTKGVKAKKVK